MVAAGVGNKRTFLETRESLRAREDDLFREWQGTGPCIVKDGAMNFYTTEAVRLLFVLKEPNDPSQSWAGDLRAAPAWFSESGYCRGTWDAIARWAAVILEGERLAQPNMPQLWMRHLARIAVVNLKKTGGAGRADHAEIAAYLADARNAGMLRWQLGFYAPHITICGGDFVGERLMELYGWDLKQWRPVERGCQGDDIWEIDSRELGRVISFWHPAQWARKADDLVGMLDEIGDELVPRFEAALGTIREGRVG